MTDRAPSLIVNRLREEGRRITRERRLVLGIIAENPHLDAAGIYRLARQLNPKIGLATVYRTLNLLTELDLVNVVSLGEDHSHYEIRGEDHVHLICLRCGSVEEARTSSDLRSLVDFEGFDVRQGRLELIGYCAKCQRDGASEDTGPEVEETKP